MPSARRTWLAAALLLMAAWASAEAQPLPADQPIVAAAADLQFALQEVAAAFHTDTGATVRLTFGSSGNFARQIRQGAPFQLYLSADESYVYDLARDGLTRDDGTLYAIGRIVLIARHDSPLRPDAALENLAAALAEGRISRFAIANPEHAPYGKRAEEALRHRGLWEALEPKLVMGENVSQAAQFAVSANAEGGIVAYSLALSERVSAHAAYALIPAEWHSPLRQRMVLVKRAGPVAERFYDYLQQPAARTILRRYGFALPGEE
jgi:molybdate transport system substrate-binding protein